nr:hypothetical protein [uncultured Pedobacter sp.]
MSIIKQSLKTSFINYIGILLGAFFTLYLTPKYLTTDFNGLYRLLLEYSSIVAIYFHFGIPTIINKYYFQIFKENSTSKGFDFFVFFVPAIMLISFGLIAFFNRKAIVTLIASKEDANLLYKYIFFLFPLIFSFAYFLILEAYSAVLGDIVFVNIFKNIVLKIFNIVSILCYILTKNFAVSLYIVSVGAVVSVTAVLFKVLYLKKFKIDLRPSFLFLRANNLKVDFWRFMSYLVFSNITVFLVSKIDIFFVGKYTDLSQLAFYATATYFVTLLLVPYSAVLNISFPSIAKSYFNKEIDVLKKLVVTNSIYGFSLALYVFLMVWINIDFIYVLIPNGNAYSAGKYVFLILGIGRLADISIGSIGQLLTVSKSYVFTLYSSVIISIVSVILGYYLTKSFGIYGSASAISFCIVLSVIYQLIIVRWKIGVTPYNSNFLRLLFIFPIILVVNLLINSLVESNFLSFLLKSSLSTGIFFGYMWYFKISEEINFILKSVYFKIRNLCGLD